MAILANEHTMTNNGLVLSSLSNFIPPKTPKAMSAPISKAKLE